MVSHPGPDILECKVKWPLRSTAVNKASGCNEILAELFKILNKDAIKGFHSLCQEIWKIQQCHRTGKDKSSSQFPRTEEPKNLLTIEQLHSSLMLVRSCLKSCMLGFSIMRTKNFQMSKLGLEKAEVPEIKLPTFPGS